jgi:putative DNA primase/helicase
MATKRKTPKKEGQARKTGTKRKPDPVVTPAEANGSAELLTEVAGANGPAILDSPRNGKAADVQGEPSPARSDLAGGVAESIGQGEPSPADVPNDRLERALAPLPQFRTIDRVVATHVDWLWKPYLPDGHVVLLVGAPEGGKSTLMAGIAAQITGGPAIEGQRTKAAGRVLIYSPEEDLGAATRPKLQAAGANLNRVFCGDLREDGKPMERICMPYDLPKLRARVRESRISAILFDPITTYLCEGFDVTDAQKVRALLDELGKFAFEESILIVCTVHYRKSREGNPMDWVAGSAAWVQVPRVVIALGYDPDRPDQRVLTLTKNSLVKDKPSRLFTLEDVDGAPRFAIGSATALTADDMGSVMQSPADREAMTEAITFLKDQLEEGDVPTTRLQLAAEAAGHSWGTIKRAKTRLGIPRVKIGSGKESYWAFGKPEVYRS